MAEAKDRAAISRSKISGETPMVINEIIDSCLYSAFYGILDSARMQAITEKILDILVTTEFGFVIVDLSVVDVIDPSAVTHLVQLNGAAKAVGAEVFFCGIVPTVAQTLIGAGVNVQEFNIMRNLKSTLRAILKKQGKEIINIA